MPREYERSIAALRHESGADVLDLLTGISWGVTELQRSMVRLDRRLSAIERTLATPRAELRGRRVRSVEAVAPRHRLPIEEEIWRNGG